MHDTLHPAWKLCMGLAMLLFVTVAVGGQVLVRQNDAINKLQDQQKSGEERSYINRAIAGCADIINDGEIEITTECTDPRVAAYYPFSICQKLPIRVEDCGHKAVVITKESDNVRG